MMNKLLSVRVCIWDLVSYAEWGKRGAIKNLGEQERGGLGTVLARQWVEMKANVPVGEPWF